VISPYAKRGYIDHQILSFDAYVKFIEDDFLRGRRLDPRTDGRPDPRPGVRENAPILGNLALDFNFNQKPRPPLILSQHAMPSHQPVTGIYIAGAITALAPGLVTIQVTTTGPNDTFLQGQTLPVATTSATAVLINGHPASAGQLHVGEAVSMRVDSVAGPYMANQISAQTP
jgi:hypothetical protein